MGKKIKDYLFYNFIWIATLVLVLTQPWKNLGRVETTLALEQDVRCGYTEHIHTAECYIGDVLICGQKAHTHSENCYLVRLADNDINKLLAMIGHTEEKSLTGVITSTVEQAAASLGETQRPIDPENLDQGTIVTLNAAITKSDSAETVVLNPNLTTSATAEDDTSPVENGPVTTGNYLNLYILLDGTLKYIGNVELSQNAYSATTYSCNVSTISEQYSSYITDISSTNIGGTYYLRYAASEPTSFSSFTGYSYKTNSTVSFYLSNVTLPIYAAFSTASFENYSYVYSPVNFYTVSLVYPDSSTSQSQIVQSGLASTLTLNTTDYDWYTDATYNTAVADTSTALSNISATTTLYAKPKGCTVTFDSQGGSDVAPQTVTPGGTATKPADPTRDGYTFDGWYSDSELTTAYDFTAAVTTDLTLHAKWSLNTYTVTFSRAVVSSQKINHGQTVSKPTDPTRDGYTFDGWYSDSELTTAYDFSTAVTGDLTLYAKWQANPTVTLIDANGVTTSETVPYNSSYTLPRLDGYVWVSGGAVYTGGTTISNITSDITFTARNKLAVTYDYQDDTSDRSFTVNPGDTVTLPTLSANRLWKDQNGATYAGGTTVTITENMTFTEVSTLTVSYDVNFPSSTDLESNRLGLKSGETEPSAIASDVVAEGSSLTVQDVSDQNVDLYLLDSSKRYSVAHFLGWEAETGEIIEPGTILSYDVLAAYDADNDNTVKLKAQWDYNRYTGVNFFIRYNIGTDTEAFDANHYTDVVFTTYLGGLESYNNSTYDIGTLNTNYAVNKSSSLIYNATEYYNFDQEIRKLYGEKATGVWLPEFPNDADMLTILQSTNTSKTLYAVESSTGNMVAITDRSTLTTANYTIRWYMFKLASEDGNYSNGGTNTWHIDGLLVKKQGQIMVTKEFLGDKEAITSAESQFYAIAQNGTLDDSTGVFTPYADSNLKKYVLVLKQSYGDSLVADTQNHPECSGAEVKVISETLDTHYYEWLIEGVTLDELWQITEYPSAVTVRETASDGTSIEKQYIYYAEYSVRDSDKNAGSNTAIAEYGEVASVVGKTYALDEDPDQGLEVSFRNYYYPNDSLLIKKEDGDTGDPLGGAEFELWQQYNNDATQLKQLKFNYDAETDMYVVNENGSITKISTGDSGYARIPIKGFSFDFGDVLVKEVTAPTGYDTAPIVRINEDTYTGTDGAERKKLVIKDVYYENGGLIGDYDLYAEVSPEETVLVVKDRTSDYVNVTVDKVWQSTADAQSSVKVVLQANSSRATNTFPALENVEVILSGDNGWTYTWQDLPKYANGSEVTWGVKEIMIGSEPALSDGESFANWTYIVVQTDHQAASGDQNETYTFQITNTRRRAQIFLTKVNTAGAALSGAVFSLEQVERSSNGWQVVSGTLPDIQTTNDYGILHFDNLTAGKYYRLTETAAPAGYVATLTPIVLTVNGEGLIQQVELGSDGTVSVLALPDSGAITYTNSYNIRVVNNPSQPLPETGGPGTHLYMQSGLLFLMAAAALFIYKILHRKEEQGFS